jgi:hypothetical protein
MTAGNCSIILLAFCFACGESEPASRAENTPSRDTTRQPASVDSVGPPVNDTSWTAGTTEGKGNASGTAVLTAVRTAAHPGFERITFEFDSAGLPPYHIEYVDTPVRACGSGEPVAIAGDAWLEVRFNGANAHTEQGAPTVPERDRKLTMPILRQLTSICDFEAEVTWVAGVATPARYRILELTGPARLAVDLRSR